MKLLIPILLSLLSFPINARVFNLALPDYYYGYFDVNIPMDLDVPLFKTAYGPEGFNLHSIMRFLAGNKDQEMYYMACYEKNDTVFLKIEPILVSQLYKVENQIAGVLFAKGWKETPFFILSTNFDLHARAMGLVERQNEMVTIKWDVAELPPGAEMWVPCRAYTSFVYYYSDNKWHPKTLLYNNTDLMSP